MASEALLFDLDGTLADTHPWYAEALAACCEADAAALCERIRSGEAAIILARRLRVEVAFLKECRGRGDQLPLYDGVREGLEELRLRGTPLALVTSLSPAVTRELLRGSGLEVYFRAVVPAERRIPKKPDPAPVLAALTRMGLEPMKSIFYIGDHVNDEHAAHGAGISFAWARYGYQDTPPTAPDVVLDRFIDVLEL